MVHGGEVVQLDERRGECRFSPGRPSCLGLEKYVRICVLDRESLLMR